MPATPVQLLRSRPTPPTPRASPVVLDEDAHEWFSVNDPDRNQTWVFDVTFLASGWQCIWGAGCEGVYRQPAQDRLEGCCTHGAHFVDGDDVSTASNAARRLTPQQWQFSSRAAKNGFISKNRDGSVRTRIVDGACIFLNRPGFAGGAGCALHAAAMAAGERPLDWKPNVCWQLPLRRDDHTDSYGHVTTTIREWKRRDWGAGGQDFHWWCTEAPEAFGGALPVWRSLADELVAMVGQAVYDRMAAYLTARPANTRLAHPAVRAAPVYARPKPGRPNSEQRDPKPTLPQRDATGSTKRGPNRA